MFILGIDGGGTKTAAAITDKDGKVYAYCTVGATNPNGVDEEKIKDEFQKLFEALKTINEQAFNQIQYVFGGFSGIENPAGKEMILTILKQALPSAQIKMENDAVNALYSGTLGKPGIVQIAGTGSITFGINANGDYDRVGGWGYLVDDEGSGYSLGREALSAVLKAYDGRGPKTELTSLILNYFQIRRIPDLIPIIYKEGHARQGIAPLSVLVSEAADANDEVAKNIIAQAGRQYGNAISALIGKLFKDDVNEPVPVVLTGGVFHRAELFIPAIETELLKAGMKARIMKPVMSPIGGSAAAAAEFSGSGVQESFVHNFNETIKKYHS